MTDFYSKLAPYYDSMYSWKDYAKEADLLHSLIQKYKTSPGNKLLDVGCGTGCHIEKLIDRYEATGLDISDAMLAVAREKCKGVRFVQDDMTSMNLGEEFDVITSMFGGIGYLTTEDEVRQAMQAFARHTKEGGVVLIEPFVTKEILLPYSIGINCVDLPDIKIARVNASNLEGSILYLNFHFLVATKEKVEHFVDPSPMGIYSRDKLVELLADSGFATQFVDTEKPIRGLLLGVKQ
ncbi:MAG: class I SAM-dependent DNA methyltransferase [Candidatus Thorarchaeota archaeon]|jgi:ubiquinone/menaquinone biosynthesis C-methylase UbiE